MDIEGGLYIKKVKISRENYIKNVLQQSERERESVGRGEIDGERERESESVRESHVG